MKIRIGIFTGVLLLAAAIVLARTWRPRVSVRPAFSPAFVEAPDGLTAVEQAYGLRLAADIVTMADDSERFDALAQGEVDVIDGPPEDPRIEEHDLLRLEDPKRALDDAGFVALMRRRHARTLRIDSFTDLAESQEKKLVAFLGRHGRDILSHTGEHLLLTAAALAIALAVALPTGIYLSKTRWQGLSFGLMSVASMIQTIPSLAMVALVALVFALVALPTIGKVPGITALVLYALLPILRNTYTGIRQVDPSVIEVARGMGMTRRQILFRVELPMSLPVIMAGVRIATVWTIGIATLVCLVGAGGLGDLIMQGLRSFKLDYLAAGTLPAAALALVADTVLSMFETWLTPKGLRSKSRTSA